MDQSLLVSRGQSCSQLSAEANSLFHAKGAGGEFHVQGYSRYVLGDQKVSAVLIPEFKYRGNVGVVQAGERQRLFSKPLPRPFLGKQTGEQHLERDLAFKLLVVSLVDDAHPTRADLGKDTVVGNRLADHHKGPDTGASLCRPNFVVNRVPNRQSAVFGGATGALARHGRRGPRRSTLILGGAGLKRCGTGNNEVGFRPLRVLLHRSRAGTGRYVASRGKFGFTPPSFWLR